MNQKNEQILTEWLVINCQMGEPMAFEQLIKLWYPKLLRYASRILADSVKAEDAVQSTLETLSSTIRKLNDPATFPKWIYRILNNKCVDIIRAKQKQDKIRHEYASFQALNKNVEGSHEGNVDFDDLLKGLEPKLYKIVHLHYLEGFSTHEIGEVLRTPVGTIKSRLHQARNLINQRLAREV